MTKYELSRPGAPWDYPTLGFRADADGAILDGSLFDPELENPPDAYWSVYEGEDDETDITRYASPSPGAIPTIPEVVNGYLLAYSDSQNTYVPTSPEDVIDTDAWSTALSASIDAVVEPVAERVTVVEDDYSPLRETRAWPVPQRLSNCTIVTRFQNGHGWGLTNATNDTSIASPLADRTVLLSPTGASAAYAEKSGLALDLSGGARLLVYVNAPTSGTDYIVYAGSTGLTHHVFWNATALETGWQWLEFTTAGATGTVGTPTLSNVQHIRVRSNANEPASSLGGVAVRAASTLYPNGVITVCFDDSNVTDYTLARPILSKYGYPATTCLITGNVGGGAPYLTEAMVRSLHDECGWEIAAHATTNAHHDATGSYPNGMRNLTDAELEADFQTMKQWLVSRGYDSGTWASPHGESDSRVWAIAQRYFNTHRGVGGQNGAGWAATAPPVRPFRVPAPSYDTTFTNVEMQTEVDRVKATKGWCVFLFHTVLAGAGSGAAIGQADFETFVDYVNAQGVAVRTFGEVWRQTTASL